MASPARPKTKPGRLSEVARHVVLPDGIVSTGWPAVRDKCLEFGDEFDGWQDGAGRAVLAKRADGKYAATIDGVTLSIPRQVAKTFLVGRIVVALCVLFPGLTVLWTAHHGRTSTRTFRSLQAFVKRKKVWPHVASIRTANGEQEIAFRNGSLIMFGAREQGFGRGFEEVDVEVFDEAQILTEKALEDMVAATNQAKHPHGALLFYMGTPPRPVDSGEAFTAKRTKALSGKMRDGVYIECSADRGANLDDHKQWAKANPSYPHRTPLESMLRLRANLPSDEAWKREALGIWDEDSAGVLTGWTACCSRPDRIVGSPSIAVDVALDRSYASIAVAGKRSDGRIQVELVEYAPGTAWVAQRCAEMYRTWKVPITLAGNGTATALIPDLEALQVKKINQLPSAQVAQACAAIADAVKEHSLAPLLDEAGLPDPVLLAAVNGAKLRTGESFVFTRKGSVDISPLYAVTLARWAAVTKKPAGRFVSLAEV
jgi:hypothetical protein